MMSKLQLLVIAVGLVAAVVGSPLPPVIDTFINPGTINKPVTTDACLQPMTKGPCDGQFTRYFYNGQSSMCETFTYSGCWGNDNNFATLKECQETCMKDALDDLPPPPEDSYFKLFP